MKYTVRLGVACLGRTTFDVAAARIQWAETKKALAALENVVIVAPDDLVIEPDEARSAADLFARSRVDGLVILSGTFHLGHLALELAKALPATPMMLWGLPELPYDGGKIRLNSVCGVNLNASNLYKSGVRNYHYAIGPSIDEDWVDGVRVLACLKAARVGIAGYRAHGFFNLSVADPAVYRATGAIVDHYELDEIWSAPAPDAEVARRTEQYRSIFDVSGISADQLAKVSALAVRLDYVMETKGLSAMAIRCWPEFAGRYGVSPCAAMSLLQSEGRVLACEGDVEGALSMLAHKALGAETPFLFDFSQVDLEEDFALFWHCGVAPCNLWDGRCVRSLDTYFAGGKGVTADFVLKDGDLSIVRLDSVDGKYRLFIQNARAVPMEKLLKGTYMKARFDRPVADVLDLVVRNGIAHHASVVYGDYLRPLRLAASAAGWEVIE
ncbi:MAG: fucose isomerase [Spirochaetes bacterium]|nr:fucose isomerase [Spirochaetota bacterium]MBU1079551.1 fucose isomerase [Spirochaetota bacterium]